MIARVLAAVVFSVAAELSSAPHSAAALEATAASPAPSPVPSIALHEIGATPGSAAMCGNVVVHANAAILATLRDDRSIARAMSRLRTNDFESFGSVRRAALADLGRASNDVVDDVDRARKETQRLRDFAAHPAGEDRGPELVAFVDPLEAALEGQRKVADALASFVTAMEYRDLRESARQAAAVKFTDPDDPDTFHTAGHMPTALATPAGPMLDREPPNATISARTQASDLAIVTVEIDRDEARAAVHSEPAVGGC